MPETHGDGRDVHDAEPADDSGKQRLWNAVRSPSRSQVVVAALLAALSFAAVTQVHEHEARDDYAGLRQADLVQALNGLNAASTRADQEIAELEQTRAALSSNTQKRASAIRQARKELDVLGILAGTLPARGPGIQMRVEVDPERLGVNQLIDCVQELRDAGAEAISINDAVRVVAGTAFEPAADGISVGGRVVAPPYQITAIGDPSTLDTAMRILGGFRDDILALGGRVEIDQKKSARIDVVHTTEPTDYASPVR